MKFIKAIILTIASIFLVFTSTAQTCDTILIASEKRSKENLCSLIKYLGENKNVKLVQVVGKDRKLEDLFMSKDSIVNEPSSFDDEFYKVIDVNECLWISGVIICYQDNEIEKAGLLYEHYDGQTGEYQGRKIYLWLEFE